MNKNTCECAIKDGVKIKRLLPNKPNKWLIKSLVWQKFS